MTTVRVMTNPIHDHRPRPRTGHLVEVLPPVEVTTDRLNFRPLALADRSQVLAALDRTRDAMVDRLPLNRAVDTDQTDGRSESDDAMFTRWVETTIETDNNRTAWRRAAFLEDGTFVGCFNLIKIERGLGWSCEANCWVDARFHKHGYASEGVEALLHFATADLPIGLGLHRVIGMIQPDNHASIRVAESLGFRRAEDADLLEINGVHRVHDRYVYTA